jgi:cytochrome c-type biogenesis protein
VNGRRAASAIVAAIAFLLAGCGGGGDAAAPSRYDAETLEGAPTSVSELRGRAVLLSSWATWCSECKDGLRSLERLWHERRDDGLTTVAVNLDARGIDRRVGPMVSSLGLTMPIWRDPDNAFASAFGAVGVPTSVLLDAEGRVVRTWVGETDFRSEEVAMAVHEALSRAGDG